MNAAGMEVSVTAFEVIFGWLPEPGSLHQTKLDPEILANSTGGSDPLPR